MKRMVDEKEVVRDIQGVEGGIKVLQLDGTSKTIEVGGSSTVNWSDIQNKPEFATVATSGDYDDLSDKPDLSIYAQSANLATVATSGDYADLLNKPAIPVMDGKTIIDNNGVKETAAGGSGTKGFAYQSGWLDWNSETSQYEQYYYDINADLGKVSEIISNIGINKAFEGLSIICSDGVSQTTYTASSAKTKAGDPTTTLRIYNIAISDFSLTAGDFRLNPANSLVFFATGTSAGAKHQLADPNDPSVLYTRVRVAINIDAADYTEINNNYIAVDNTTIVKAIKSSGFNIYKYLMVNDSALDYTHLKNKPSLATVATTGAYSDLSGTPTIPAAVSGVNDGTNWTSLTIGSDTYAIPQGGGSAPSNMVTTDTQQTISGGKTFNNPILIGVSGGYANGQIYASNGGEDLVLQYGGAGGKLHLSGVNNRDFTTFKTNAYISEIGTYGTLIDNIYDTKLYSSNNKSLIINNSSLILTNLPTSDPQVAGAIWNDNGTLKVSSGS